MIFLFWMYLKMPLTIIPESIEQIYNFFNCMEGQKAKEPKPIPISALIDNPFFEKEDIKNNMTYLWEVIENEDIFIWIIQSKMWDKKTWRNHYVNKFQSKLSISLLIFISSDYGFKDLIEEFSMTIITIDGVLDYKSVIPRNPNESILKIWEALRKNKLNDILEFESQITYQKYQVTAEKLYNCLLENNIEQIFEIFKSAGHLIENHCILPVNDAVIDHAVLYLSENEVNPIEIMEQYKGLLINKQKSELKWIIALTPNKITYFEKNRKISDINISITKRNKKNDKSLEKDSVIQILASLVSVVSRRAIFNADTFALQYGDNSILCHYALDLLKNSFNNQIQGKIAIIFEEWKKRFETVYRSGVLKEELFLKHTYLALLIRLVLYVVYFPTEQLKSQSIFEMTNWLENKGFSIFTNDFFSWALEEIHLIENLYYGFRPLEEKQVDNDERSNRLFEADDIFRTIYQQMVTPSTRHDLGEFYTPPELARLMVEEEYKFGEKVLDPACGSGTFLVEIIRKIKSSHSKTIQEQIDAIENIYGFDINPIAIATSKANFLLHIKDIIDESKEFKSHIFLTNSIKPIEFKKDYPDLQFGKCFNFSLTSLRDNILISTEFLNFNNLEKFGIALSKLDSILLKSEKQKGIFKNELNNYLDSDNAKWLNQKINNNVSSLKDNFISIAEKMQNLSINNKNHIWTYLLYQSLGAYLITNSADLIIGNPPWLVYKDIQNKSYQMDVLEKIKEFDIEPEVSQRPNLEMSALFLYGSTKFLKNNGRIFFVVSNGFMTGENHSKTRKFQGFENVKFWKFNRDIFKIHNICIFATFNKNVVYNLEQLRNREFPVTTFDIEEINSKKIILIVKKQEKYKSYFVEENKNGLFVKKLVPVNEIDNLLPIGTNYYENNFFQGSVLGPRNFLFVEIIKIEGDYVYINHIEFDSSKDQWKVNPLNILHPEKKSIKIEKKFLFKVVTSYDIAPFITMSEKNAFLPINRTEEGYRLVNDENYLAIKYFKELDKLYNEMTTKMENTITNLWDNIDFRNKLSTTKQLSLYKVVMPAIGTIVKAALVLDSTIIIDSSLYYIALDSLDEAYFLLGYLNSPCLTFSINIIQSEGAGGGGRNIHKRPFEFKLPKFDSHNQKHQKIVEISKKLYEKSILFKKNWFESESEFKPQTFKNRIYEHLGWNTKNNEIKDEFLELNQQILSLFESNNL